MKTGIATALSVVGVLAAGAAAFAVNNSVLGATGNESLVAQTTVPVTVPVGYVSPAGVVAPATTVAPAKPVNANATEVGTDTTTYKVGAAGAVVLDTSSGAIVVTGIAPSAGYTSEPATTDANGTVKVRFLSSTQRIEFIARMVDGQVKVEVRNENIQNPVAAPAAPRHDDDDDDRHEEDHDDDREHDEDDD